jgi:DNA helicase-2/ATP-dependent DNA helicase PcrA
VLTTRIARLIDVEGVDPRNILAVTFTNKAAGEMRERIGRILGSEPAGMWVGTFHAIGARMLRSAAHLVQRTASYTIYDQDDSLGVIKRLMERHRISPKQFTPRAVQSVISDAKNRMVMPSEYEHLALDPFSKAVAPVYRSLGEALQLANAVDFDDLLVLPVRMLQHNADKLASYRERFRYILVDEYQDTNRAQYELIKLLGGEHGNVCVVGDDDQSIYGWRGADIRNILDFNKDFPNPTIVRLEENYRSTPQILDLGEHGHQCEHGANGQDASCHAPIRRPVTVVRCLDERDEADFRHRRSQIAPRCVAESSTQRHRRALSNQRTKSRARGSAAQERDAVSPRRLRSIL